MQLRIRFFLGWLALFSPCMVAAQTDSSSVLLPSFAMRQTEVSIPSLRVTFSLSPLPDQTPPPSAFFAQVGRIQTSVESISRFNPQTEGVAYTVLLEVSRYISKAEFTNIRSALLDWLHQLMPKDQVALITFGDTVRVKEVFTQDVNRLINHLQLAAPTDTKSSFAQAVIEALRLRTRKQPNLPRRHVILSISTGHDESPTAFSWSAMLRELNALPTPLYGLGLDVATARPDELARLAELSQNMGGIYFEAPPENLKSVFEALNAQVRNVFIAQVLCPLCPADGSTQLLQMTYQTQEALYEDAIEVRLQTSLDVPSPSLRDRFQAFIWVYRGGIIGVLGVFGVLGFGIYSYLRSRKKNLPQKEPDTRSPNTDPETLPASLLPPPAVGLLSSTQGILITVTVIEGPTPGAAAMLHVQHKEVFGRASGQLPFLSADKTISSKHFALYIDGLDLLTIEDLGSTNKTFVNGIAIRHEQTLQNNDVIRAGKTLMRVNF